MAIQELEQVRTDVFGMHEPQSARKPVRARMIEVVRAGVLSMTAFAFAVVTQGAFVFRADLPGQISDRKCELLDLVTNTGLPYGLVMMRMAGDKWHSALRIRFGRIDLSAASTSIQLFDPRLPLHEEVSCGEAGSEGCVAVAGRNIWVFDVARCQELRFSLPRDLDGLINAVACDDNLLFLLVSDSKRNLDRIVAVDRSTTAEVWRSDAVEGLNSTCLVLHQQCGRLLCGGRQGEIVRLDASTGEIVAHQKVDSIALRHLAVSPDGRLLLSADVGGRVRLYELTSMSELWMLQCHACYKGASPLFTPDGQAVIVAGPEFGVAAAALEAQSGRQLARVLCSDIMPRAGNSIPHVIEVVSSRQVFLADSDGGLTLWDWKSQIRSVRLTTRLQPEGRGSLLVAAAGGGT